MYISVFNITKKPRYIKMDISYDYIYFVVEYNAEEKK